MGTPDTRRTIFYTEWFSVEEVFFADEAFEGKPYYTIHAPDGVIVLAVTAQEEIVLIRQFRPALKRWTLEMPSGGIDAGEMPEQAAVRELYEETGYRADNVTALVDGYIYLNRSDARTYAYFAGGVVKDVDFQAKEKIEVRTISLAQYKEMMLRGEIDQFSSLALLALADWKLGKQFIR
jgi:ADP-ribose pyrophosphatase